MKDWSKPKQDAKRDWSKPKAPEAKQTKRKPFPGEGLVLGLGQWAEDSAKGLTSHGAEPEVDMPNNWRPEKLNNKPETNRSPSFGLEEMVDPDQKMQFNVGRYGIDAALGGYGLAKGASYLAGKTIGKLTPKSVGKGIVKDVKDLKKSFKDEYGSIFDAAESKGVKNIKSKTDKSELEAILKEVDSKYYSGLESFLKNPTARNAHEAQSDLGKFVRKMESKKDLVGNEKEALKLARKTQGILKNEVYSSLLQQGGLDLPFKYQDVTKRYATEMVPYLENKDIRRAVLQPTQKGYIKPERVPQKLKLESSDPLMEHLRGKKEGTKTPINPALYGKYPLLGVSQALGPTLKYGAIGSGLTYGTYGLIRALLGKS